MSTPPTTPAAIALAALLAAPAALAQDDLAFEPGAGEIRGSYLLGAERLHADPEVLWPGFLSGLRGFEHFYAPVGMPIYFETPFNNTELRALYIHHSFPDGSTLDGGDLNVYALQARVALTERLGFIATKDGWSDLSAGALPDEKGWNDIAIGLKYVFIADRDNDFALAGGLRWEWRNGDEDVLQGGDSDELSPFVSVAKGFDRLHFIGAVTYRIPTDGDAGNEILNWSLHVDYEILPDVLPGFAPMLELHGNHYLTNGEGPALGVGGLDYTNLGTSDVKGNDVVWLGVGGRWKLNPHASIGATYEFALTDKDDDIIDDRVTVDFIVTW